MVRSKPRIGGAGIAGALALLVIAGCGGSGGGNTPAKTPVKSTGAIYAPRDVTFGVLAPTSGRHQQRGQDLVDGAKMAMAELNVRGGVNGHKVALVTYDDGCDAKTARERAQALKGSDEVAGALGGICESAASAAARTLGSGLPFLVTSA